MRDELLKSLLKSKANDKKSIKGLIETFIKETKENSSKEIKAALANLLVFIDQNHELDENTLREIVLNKLKDIQINFKSDNLEAIYIALALSAYPASKVGFVFDRVDIDAIEAMRKSFYWVKSEYNQNFQNRLKDIIEDTFRGKLPRVELATKLREEFSDLFDMDIRYFEGVADHIISQSQNIARVLQGIKYGVRYFQVMATIDDKTSDICRSMHGRIIPAQHLENQIKNILNAKSIGEKKAAALWRNEPFLAKELPENFGLPPYHFRCRTEVVPAWIRTEIKADKKTGKKYKIKAATLTYDDYKLIHIDKTGLETKIKPQFYDKIINKHGLSEKELVGALNDIKYKAPHALNSKHKNERIKTIGLANSGYCLIWQGDELVTVFAPQKGAKRYFNENAIEGKVIDVDSGKKLQRVKKWYEIF